MTELKLGLFKTHKDVILPKFATKQSACFDMMCQTAGKQTYKVYTNMNKMRERAIFDNKGTNVGIHIGPGERVAVPTGIIMDIPEGHSVRIHSRSGLAFKNGLVLINGEGVVDSDFVEEGVLLMYNVSNTGITIRDGDRIAQAELVKDLSYEFEELKTRPTTKTDRIGGFGSTGVSNEAKTEVKSEIKPQVVLKRPVGRPRLNRG